MGNVTHMISAEELKALEEQAECFETEAPTKQAWAPDKYLLPLGQPTPDTPEPDKDEPDKPDADTALIRAWQIAYTDLGAFSMVGTSTEDVVRRIELLKDNYSVRPYRFAPVKILNHAHNRVDTIWLIPAKIIGVFGEYEAPEEVPDPMSSFQKLMEAAASQQGPNVVVDVDPPELNGKGAANDNDA